MWVPGLFHSLFYLGLGEAAISLLNRKEYDQKEVVGSLNTLALALLTMGGIFYFSLSPWILEGLHHQLPFELYQQAFWLFPLTLFWAYWASDLLALGKVIEVNWGRVINQGSQFILLLLWFFLSSGRTELALWALISSATVEIAFIALLLRRLVPLRLTWSPPLFRQQLRLGSQMTLATWLSFFRGRLDILLASFFGGVFGVGLYSVATGLRDLCLNLPQIFVRPILSASARHSTTEVISVLAKASQSALLLMVLLGSGLFLTLPWLIEWIYSSSFAGAVTPARWLLAGFVAQGLSDILSVGFVGFGKPRPVVLSQCVGLGCLLFTGFILASLWGISGVAMAVSLSQIMGLVILLFSLRRHFPEKFQELFLVGWRDWRRINLSALWNRDHP